jgi:hypothetical protein
MVTIVLKSCSSPFLWVTCLHFIIVLVLSGREAILWLQHDAQTDAHPLFERMSDEELESDPAACLLTTATEEGQKVARNSGQVC